MSDFPFGTFVAAIILLAIYIAPTIVAFRREHPNRWVIAAINVAFGGTVLGWLVALVWANQVVHLSNLPGGSNGGESGLNLFVNDITRVRIVPDDDHANAYQADGAISIQQAAKELERLKRLRDTNAVTNEQFEALKADLLRRVV